MKSILLLIALVLAVQATSSINQRIEQTLREVPLGRTPHECTAWSCVPEGSACGLSGLTYDTCSFGSWCNNSVCIGTLALGATCDADFSLGLCSPGTYCGPDNTCIPVTYDSNYGEPCSFGPYVNCAGQFVCNFTTLTCVDLPILGQSCSTIELCGGAAYCDIGGTLTCLPLFSQPIGGTCQSANECQPELYCDAPRTYPFLGTCQPSVNSSFDVCTTAADCPSSLETCRCSFLPYNDPTRCVGPAMFTPAQADATTAYYQCMYDNNCGAVACDACKSQFCNWFEETQNIPISVYGHSQTNCLGQYSIVSYVEANC